MKRRLRLPDRRFVLRLLLLLVVPAVAAFVGLGVYARSGRIAETENAYVKSDIVAVSAEISGRVVEVPVRDNESVAAGAVLLRIDPQPFEIAIARARAQMEVVRTDVQSLRAEYRASLREAEEAEESIAFLARQFQRQEKLREAGMSRADAHDEARHNLELARRRLVSVQERTSRVVASLAGDPNLPVERFPRYLEAKASLDAAEADLARTVVRAPSAGVVSNMKLQAGEHVARGVPVFSLISSQTVWVEANYKETQLTHMRVGQPASITVDAYPDQEWKAVVASIAPATGAEFAILPPQNATGNWVKVVQRIPVRLEVQQEPGAPPLRAGMTATVTVDTGHANGLPKTVRWLFERGVLPRFLLPAQAHAGD